MAAVLLIFGFIAGIVVYFLPALIANKTRNSGKIMTVNLLFGWTVLGWLVCLIWALTDQKK